MVDIVTFSGWGQAFDSLKTVTPQGAKHIDYSNFKNVNDLFAAIKNMKADVVLGWSLGGQIALRAISEKILQPKTLFLLATPYQFVASKDVKCAMDSDTFNAFRHDFESDPVRMLKRFITLVTTNDKNAHDVISRLKKEVVFEHAARWLFWLDELESFSCNSIDFSVVPKTIAIHGRDDTIVDISQTSFFHSLIKNYTVEVLDNCGHAPHISASQQVSKIIEAAIK